MTIWDRRLLAIFYIVYTIAAFVWVSGPHKTAAAANVRTDWDSSIQLWDPGIDFYRIKADYFSGQLSVETYRPTYRTTTAVRRIKTIKTSRAAFPPRRGFNFENIILSRDPSKERFFPHVTLPRLPDLASPERENLSAYRNAACRPVVPFREGFGPVNCSHPEPALDDLEPDPQQCGMAALGVGGGCAPAVTVTGGWTWLQGTSGGNGATGGSEVQLNACGSTTGTFVTACSIKVFTTTAGDDMLVGRVMGEASTGHIISAYSCATSNPCLSSSGDLKDTFSLCPGSSCLLTNSGMDHDDAAYVAGGVGGATIITVNVNAAPVTFDYAEFVEVLPPMCGASVCASTVDNSGNGNTALTTSGSGCSPCTGPSFTVTGTDAIVEIIDTNSTVNTVSAGYNADFIGNLFSLNNTTGTAVTFDTSQQFSLTGLAFKVATFTPPSAPFTFANGPVPPQNFSFACVTASPCSITPPSSASGDMLVIVEQPNSSGGPTMTAVSGRGGTWTVPTGANTCQNTAVWNIGCAYNLTSTGGAGALSITMSATCASGCNFYIFDIAKNSGTFALDAQNSSNTTTATTLTGQTLSLNGSTPDVCFVEYSWLTTSSVEYVVQSYPNPGGGNFFGNNTENSGAVGLLLNTITGGTPKIILSGASGNYATGAICFHN
ncbi:MAG: hypothetical protein WB780_21195 [Candidatus Acidiferrales bacterium]